MEHFKEIGWAYPTSTNAEQFGFGKTGCFIVQTATSHNRVPKAVAGFATRGEALTHAKAMPGTWNPIFVQLNPEFAGPKKTVSVCCKAPTTFYDGALGYSSFTCDKCGKDVADFFPTGDINPMNPWEGIEYDDSEFAQLEVEREGKDVACIVEVDWQHVGDDEGRSTPDDINIGRCFTVRGELVELTEAEQSKARENWIWVQERKPAYEPDDSDRD